MALPANNPALIKASGGHYTSLTGWEADLDDANLDDDYVAEMEGQTTFNGSFYGIDGSDGDPDPYKVIIQAKSGFEADGTNEATCAKNVGAIGLSGTAAVRFEVSGIEVSDGVSGFRISNVQAGTENTITKNVIRDTTTDAGIFISAAIATTITRIGVNLFINCGSAAWDSGIKINDADYTSTNCKILNNTIFHSAPVTNCPGVYEAYGQSDFRNNAVCYYDNGGENTPIDYLSSVSNVDYCAGSGDSTVDDGADAGIHNIDTLRDDGTDWTDTSTCDFSLVSDGVLTGAGVAISGESWFPATDMAGENWATPPSIGCFEYVAAGGGNAPTGTFYGPLCGPFAGPI